jgi:hypothetical protein
VQLQEFRPVFLLGVDLDEDEGGESLLDLGIGLRRTGEGFAAASPIGVEIDQDRLSTGLGQGLIQGVLIVAGRRRSRDKERREEGGPGQGKAMTSRHDGSPMGL